jgi:hypothetical protein
MEREKIAEGSERSQLGRATRGAARFGGAVALGAVGAYLGMLLGRRFFAGDPAGFGDIVASLGGIVVGYTLGSALGCWLVERLLGGRGALWAALIGSVAGVGLTLAGFRLFPSGQLILAWLLIFVCGAVGAVGGAELSGSHARRGEPASRGAP